MQFSIDRYLIKDIVVFIGSDRNLIEYKYDEKGKIIETIYKKDNNIIVKKKRYFRDVKTIEYVNINGIIQGKYFEWTMEGLISCMNNYKYDELNGKCIYWQGNGEIMGIYNYKNDYLHGIQREWNYAGNKLTELLYIDGKEVTGKIYAVKY